MDRETSTGTAGLRLLVAISGCEVYEVSGFQQPMRDTWLKDAIALGIDYKFFHGRGGKEREDVVLVDCCDEYYDLTTKTKLKCRWAVDHGYDFIFLCFPDTYACPERLLTCGFEQYDYFGDLLYHANGEYCQGGQGYFLSKRAADYIASDPRNYPNEDCFVGDLMRERQDLKRGDSRYFYYAGIYPSGGPLATNKVVSTHLSTDTPDGYRPKYMYRRHDLWLASHGKATMPMEHVNDTLLDLPIVPIKPPEPNSPKRVLRTNRPM